MILPCACAKAFLALLLPEDNPFWTAKENNGPWEKEFKKNHVYNKFQPATNLLITDYPNVGGAEMRSWCHETVAADWQKFRSSENYNKLAYHTEFPWMADGKNGEVSMNYATKNYKGAWEVLRLYTFKSFENGIYRRDAVLETNSKIQYKLADIPIPNGVIRVDKVSVPQPTTIRFGHYTLPLKDNETIVKGLEYAFEKKNYLYQSVSTLREAESLLEDTGFALVILDISLPDGDGLSFYEEVVKRKGLPTLFLTAVDEEETVVKGLNLGAEDYVTKPFSTKELLARINRIFLRNGGCI